MNIPDIGSIVTSPRARAILYSGFLLLCLAALIVQKVYETYFIAGDIAAIPTWLDAAEQVIILLGVAFAGLAKANTPSPALTPARGPYGQTNRRG